MLTRPAFRPVLAATLAALLAAGSLPALAQDTTTVTPAAPASAVPDPTPEHLQAAVDFLMASGATSGFQDMIPQFLDQVRLRYVSQRPEIAQMINDSAISLVPEFVKRRDDLNAQLGKLYAAHFTEDELNQLTEFYHSPLGHKLATEQVGVLQQSIPVVQAWSRKLTEDMAIRVKQEVKKKGQQL